MQRRLDAGLALGMGVLVVNPSFPAKTVPEFIAYAKSNPGKVSVGSGGVGSGSHVFWALFTALSGASTVQHALDLLLPEAGSIYVMDRGYVDFTRLYVLHQAGALFVTRAKSKLDAHPGH